MEVESQVQAPRAQFVVSCSPLGTAPVPRSSPHLFSRAPGLSASEAAWAWSVCRLGRSLPDLIGLLDELRARDIDLYLRQQARDTSAPCGRMLFGPWPVKVDGVPDQSTSVRKPEMAVMSSHPAFFSIGPLRAKC